jgi:DNA (cytosine-5)-methyltransferase 1
VLNGLDLFSGIGGLTVALAPWVQPVAYCESDDYAQGVLLSRMREGRLPVAPIWDDVRQLHGTDLERHSIDIIYGGFPCQDLSTASHGLGGGIDGEQSGLWKEMLRLVIEIKPQFVFIENVAAWRKWVPRVRADLHAAGYSSLPVSVSASQVGAPFQGERVFVAATNRNGQSACTVDAQTPQLPATTGLSGSDWGPPPPEALGVADGVPHGLERLNCLGNAVVSEQAGAAFRFAFKLPEAA